MKRIIIPFDNLFIFRTFIFIVDNQFSLTPEDNAMARGAFHKAFPDQTGETHPLITDIIPEAIPAEHNAVIMWLMPDQKIRITTGRKEEVDESISHVYIKTSRQLKKAVEEMHAMMVDVVG